MREVFSPVRTILPVNSTRQNYITRENYSENLCAITRNFAQLRLVMRNCALIFGETFPGIRLDMLPRII